jgi:hypothetical protein
MTSTTRLRLRLSHGLPDAPGQDFELVGKGVMTGRHDSQRRPVERNQGAQRLAPVLRSPLAASGDRGGNRRPPLWRTEFS